MSIDSNPAARPSRGRCLPALAALVGLLTAVPSLGRAQETRPEPTRHALELGAGASDADAFGRLRYRARLPGGVQLGVVTRHAAVWKHIVVGYAVDSGYLMDTRAELAVPLYDDGQMWFGFELQPGIKWFVGPEGQGVNGDVDGSTAFVLDGAILTNVRVDRTWTVRAGIRVPFSLEVEPEVVNDVTGTLLVGGFTAALSDDVQLFAELETGGLFGAEGDGAKFVIRGATGVRLLFGGRAPARAWTTF